MKRTQQAKNQEVTLPAAWLNEIGVKVGDTLILSASQTGIMVQTEQQHADDAARLGI